MQSFWHVYFKLLFIGINYLVGLLLLVGLCVIFLRFLTFLWSWSLTSWTQKSDAGEFIHGHVTLTIGTQELLLSRERSHRFCFFYAFVVFSGPAWERQTDGRARLVMRRHNSVEWRVCVCVLAARSRSLSSRCIRKWTIVWSWVCWAPGRPSVMSWPVVRSHWQPNTSRPATAQSRSLCLHTCIQGLLSLYYLAGGRNLRPVKNKGRSFVKSVDLIQINSLNIISQPEAQKGQLEPDFDSRLGEYKPLLVSGHK